MDIFAWIQNLPSSTEWPESDSPLTLKLASSNSDSKALLFKAHRTSGSKTQAVITFSLHLHGFCDQSESKNEKLKTIWVSNPCPLNNRNTCLLSLLTELIQETIERAPTAGQVKAPVKLDPELLFGALGLNPRLDDPSFCHLFNLAFLCRLFWLCVCDAPAEVGSMFFQAMDSTSPSKGGFDPDQCKVFMWEYLSVAGADCELLFMRALGYMLTKWLIWREFGSWSRSKSSGHGQRLGFGQAREVHGLMVLKGYVPILGMQRVGLEDGDQDHLNTMNLDIKASVLRYALAHQQLEVVVQLEFSVCKLDATLVRVGLRLANLRIHVTRLGFADQGQDQVLARERHHPSKVQIWTGPVGNPARTAVATLGRSTENLDKVVKIQRSIKGTFGSKTKSPKVKASSTQSRRTRTKDWSWEQDVEGNTVVFEGVKCKNAYGTKVDACTKKIEQKREMAPRGLVFASDQYGEEVSWRMGVEDLKCEMDGGDLGWRLGVKVWLNYRPSDFNKSYSEARCVEWDEELKLLQLPSKLEKACCN